MSPTSPNLSNQVIDTKSSSSKLGKQCTHVETDAIRYVYVPIEKLFLVLITTKNSNIIEDLEVLRQLNQVVAQACS